MEGASPDDFADAMDLEHDPLEGLYDDASAPPPDDGAVGAPLPRDWEAALRQRVRKRHRPQDWGTALHGVREVAAEEGEPNSKMARYGDVLQEDLDAANKPFRADVLQELHFRIHHHESTLEDRNRALAELAKLQRNLCYYQFRMDERVAQNSARMQPLLGEPLLVEVTAYPDWKPGEKEPRLPPKEETGLFRRITMFPAITVDLIDGDFIAALGGKRRITVYLPNMEWADEVRVLAERFGSRNVTMAFGLRDGGMGSDLIHFLKWLVGQTCYLSLRTSRQGYWHHQDFKSITNKCTPFGSVRTDYLKYIYQQHLLDDDFVQYRPREHETLVEIWTGAMQTLETCSVVGEDSEGRPLIADSNFPRIDWMPLPVKELLARLARHGTTRFWHPAWNALDYCLLLGEWFLTTS